MLFVGSECVRCAENMINVINNVTQDDLHFNKKIQPNNEYNDLQNITKEENNIFNSINIQDTLIVSNQQKFPTIDINTNMIIE